MSILYFAACAISCFGPIVAIYKGTQVCEQPGTRWLMAVSALAYLFTQLVKSLLMVSLLPESCSSYILCETITQAFLRCIDFLGLCFTVHHKTALSFESNTRLLSVGLGWSLAHAVFTNLLPLLANLRGTTGFQWRYIYGALAGSSSIVSWTALAALAFLMTRRRKQQPLFVIASDAFPSAGIICAVLLFFPFLCSRIVVGQTPSTVPGDSRSWWISLCIQTGVNVVAAAFTLQSYYAKVSSTSAHNSVASGAGGGRGSAQSQSDRHTNGARAKGPESVSLQD